MTSEASTRPPSRLQGRAAGPRSQNVQAAIIVSIVTACAIGGVLGSWTFLAFFAVGAGAGYSLSGSV